MYHALMTTFDAWSISDVEFKLDDRFQVWARGCRWLAAAMVEGRCHCVTVDGGGAASRNQ